MLKSENKAKLTSVLTYHVVPGSISAADIAVKAKTHGGTASYKTVEGGKLMFRKGPRGGWLIMDGKGDTGHITIANVRQSNGMIHVIDTVMMP